MTRDRVHRAGILLALVIVAMASVALGRRAWWIVPPVAFVVMIAYMLIDRRRPVTLGWVLFAALLASALGAVLWLI